MTRNQRIKSFSFFELYMQKSCNAQALLETCLNELWRSYWVLIKFKGLTLIQLLLDQLLSRGQHEHTAHCTKQLCFKSHVLSVLLSFCPMTNNCVLLQSSESYRCPIKPHPWFLPLNINIIINFIIFLLGLCSKQQSSRKIT